MTISVKVFNVEISGYIGLLDLAFISASWSEVWHNHNRIRCVKKQPFVRVQKASLMVELGLFAFRLTQRYLHVHTPLRGLQAVKFGVNFSGLEVAPTCPLQR